MNQEGTQGAPREVTKNKTALREEGPASGPKVCVRGGGGISEGKEPLGLCILLDATVYS